MSLPCKHIFAVRRRFGMPLFDRTLCHERWTRNHVQQNERLFRNATQQCNEIEHDLPTPTTIQTAPRWNVRTAAEKRRLLKRIVDDIVSMGSNSCGVQFNNRVDALMEISNAWRKGLEVRVETVGEVSATNNTTKTSESEAHGTVNTVENIDTEMEKLVLAKDAASNLDDITMPSPMRTRGRPCGFNSTTTGFFPRKFTQKNSNVPDDDEKLRSDSDQD